MDATLHGNIMNGLMLTTLVLLLTSVYILTRSVKYKAIYVFHLGLAVERAKHYRESMYKETKI